VIPSLPGHGFSAKPATTGWDPARIARAWVVLMKRLGYTQFAAQGGDWGAAVTQAMGERHRDLDLAVHHRLDRARRAYRAGGRQLDAVHIHPGVSSHEVKALLGGDRHPGRGGGNDELRRPVRARRGDEEVVGLIAAVDPVLDPPTGHNLSQRRWPGPRQRHLLLEEFPGRSAAQLLVRSEVEVHPVISSGVPGPAADVGRIIGTRTH
jgi:pimeloyl-ACP methyl ester carboxylesterase